MTFVAVNVPAYSRVSAVKVRPPESVNTMSSVILYFAMLLFITPDDPYNMLLFVLNHLRQYHLKNLKTEIFESPASVAPPITK